MKKLKNKPLPLSKIFSYITITLLIVLYFTIRARPIYLDSVSFTYDQGRDFLKAAEIASKGDLTFIGPTTGIQGIFHGAWWYYLLAVIFVFFGGNPQGFYYGILLIQAIFSLIFLTFVWRYMDHLSAIILGGVITISPYFITTAITAGNNVMVLPAMVMFLLSHAVILGKGVDNFNSKVKIYKKWTILFVGGLALGLIAEFEFAFGLLLAPVYLIISLLLPQLRKNIYALPHALFFFGGLFFTFLPRILFEVKNGFPQTQTLWRYILEPTYYTERSYLDNLDDRLMMIVNFYTGIFPSPVIAWLFASLAGMLFIYAVIKKRLEYSTIMAFSVFLVAGLFGTSLLYKDSFWGYYYEGFPYIYLLLLAAIFSFGIRLVPRLRPVFALIPVFCIFLGAAQIMRDMHAPIHPGGLKEMKKVVQHITSQEGNTPFCIRVYTPPVIPHTYNYLFFYEAFKNKTEIPTRDWVENTCWFIVEYDPYPERVYEWKKNEIPLDGEILSTKRIWDIDVYQILLKNE